MHNNQTVINNGQVGTFKSVNIFYSFKAWLGHDNKYFDRVCPTEGCRGMYSSYETATCPKCGAQLTFITLGDGRAMGISEGTFYPVLTQKQKEADLKNTMSRPGGVERTYRFKMFSFSGPDGALAPPPAHAFCKKGAMIKIQSVNHQSITSTFMGKDQRLKLEEMFLIYENYGDSVELLQGPKKSEITTSYNVDAQGNPTPLTQTAGAGATNDVAAELADLKQKYATLLNHLSGGAQPQPQTPPPVTNPTNVVVNPQPNVVAAPETEINPFGNAI